MGQLIMAYFIRLLLLISVSVFSHVAHASNIDLSTLPARDSIQLTIYNAEDLTLVRETRRLSFKPGRNPLQFSWVNTLIDPSSVMLRFLSHAQQLSITDTTYPHDKPNQLYWQVQSQDWSGEAIVEISYFTSGISWQADYVAIADATETKMMLESFVRITNQSGEDYDHAEVRLVVGSINLVENIAQLASLSKMEQDFAPSVVRKSLSVKRKKHLAEKRQQLRGAMSEMADNLAFSAPEPKKIAKQSLSEYFIYSIEGTESIPHGWSKRLPSFKADNIAIKTVYRYRQHEYGDQLVRFYLLKNNTDSQLGTTPLPDGAVAIFQQQQQGLRYLATHALQYVPIGDQIELLLGHNPEVIFELVKQKVWRDEIWMHLNKGNLYRKVGGNLSVSHNNTVAGWDEHVLYRQHIRNYSNKAISLEVRRHYAGDTLFRSQLKPRLYDYATVEYKQHVIAGKSKQLDYEVVQTHGYKAKSQRVRLK